MGGPWVSFMVTEVYSLWHKGINRSVLLLFTVSVNNLISVPFTPAKNKPLGLQYNSHSHR